MINRRSFRQALERVVAPLLEPYGYQFIGVPKGYECPGRGPYAMFFQKQLWDDVYSTISFQVSPLHMEPQEEKRRLRGFCVELLRHKGPQPDFRPESPEFKGQLSTRLAYLLWAVLDVKVYGWQAHQWGFSTEEELDTQLRDATETLIIYGIPWLEDPNTEDKRLSGEELEKHMQETIRKLTEQGYHIFGQEGKAKPG